MRETNTPCVPFDVLLFYHWERCEKELKLITCVIVVWKNVSPIDFLPVHILQVSFRDCRPLSGIDQLRFFFIWEKNRHRSDRIIAIFCDFFLGNQIRYREKTEEDCKDLLSRKKNFPETSKIRRNSGNPKKTEILVFRISKKSIW